MLHDLTVNSDYATLKQTAAERMMWRHSGGISRTCSTEERERESLIYCMRPALMSIIYSGKLFCLHPSMIYYCLFLVRKY